MVSRKRDREGGKGKTAVEAKGRVKEGEEEKTPEVSSSLLQFVKGEVSRSSPVVALPSRSEAAAK